MRRLLTVVPAAVLLAACGAPKVAPPTVPAAVAAPAGPTAKAAAEPLGVVPVEMGPAPARAVPVRAEAQAVRGCNANYAPCVPDDAVDVDCQDGSGNGPSYVTGRVTVVGDDVYGLDADHDGIGCEAATGSAAQPAPPAAGPAAQEAAQHEPAPAPQRPVRQHPAPQQAAQPAPRQPGPHEPAPQEPDTQPSAPAPEPPTPGPTGGCNANYTPCVPNDPVDVDCEGGSGNGPSYVTGPVTVVGDDVYGLDSDDDGLGCE
jgi:hypothetical protein